MMNRKGSSYFEHELTFEKGGKGKSGKGGRMTEASI